MSSYSKSIVVISFLLCLLLNINLLFAQSGAVDHQQVDRVLQFSDSTGATKAMLMHSGEVIGSFSSEECDSTYMNTASMVKSWTGLAVGVLADQGKISVDDEVCEYLPDWEAGCKNDVTIKQLLTMSSGLLKIRPASKSILAQDDMNAFALKQDLPAEPGSRFSYSNEGVQLLGIMIEQITGQTANDFFTEHLFEPLGMDSTRLYVDKSGNDMVYGGAKTTVQDAAKIGQLVLNDGRYQGNQVISEDWISRMLTSSKTANYYGYLWWISPSHIGKPLENYAAMGDRGQLTVVYPNKNLVYVRQQSCKKEGIPNMSWSGLEFYEMVGRVIESK